MMLRPVGCALWSLLIHSLSVADVACSGRYKVSHCSLGCVLFESAVYSRARSKYFLNYNASYSSSGSKNNAPSVITRMLTDGI